LLVTISLWMEYKSQEAFKFQLSTTHVDSCTNAKTICGQRTSSSLPACHVHPPMKYIIYGVQKGMGNKQPSFPRKIKSVKSISHLSTCPTCKELYCEVGGSPKIGPFKSCPYNKVSSFQPQIDLVTTHSTTDFMAQTQPPLFNHLLIFFLFCQI
jgi:hypothetical protein